MERPGRWERRGARARKEWTAGVLPDPVPGQRETSSALHGERLDAVMGVLRADGARTVADLGCGSGALLRRLVADPRFTRIVGVDASLEALATAERLLRAERADPARVSLRHGSFLDPGAELAGFDAAVMVEALEHVDPALLSRLERGIFAALRPRLVVLTTPNRDYNARLGLAEGRLRHPDHRFEWSRARFRAWAGGVAARNGFAAEFREVGRSDPLLGSATQMAVFRRAGP